MADSQLDEIRSWFLWMGRLETASFLGLLGIAMPLKYLADTPGPVVWVGMLHGAMVLVYLVALLSVGRVFKIGVGQLLLASALAMVPFGPVVLEQRWRKRGLLGSA